MNKKALDEKYSYQIDEHNVVHLFRGEDNCQQYLTNPLLGAIFKIETLEKENAELKETVIKMNNVITETFSNLTKAKELLKRFIGLENCTLDYDDIKEAEQFLKEN